MDAPRSRERDIERAWALHEPLRATRAPRCPPRRERFKQRIAPNADKIKRIYQSLEFRALLNDWARKGAVGRERAKRKIVQMLAPAPVDDAGGALMLMWAETRAQMIIVDHPSFSRTACWWSLRSLSGPPAACATSHSRSSKYPITRWAVCFSAAQASSLPRH